MQKKLTGIPSKPGVYIFKGTKERVLYVGKAKNLINRVRSYFGKSAELDARKAALVKTATDLSYIITDNELEALVLEANLIKQYKPKFNVILRDDKNYPYLKLTVNEEWPRIEVVRRIKKDGALYFGPYVPASSMWETLAFIRRHFQIRDCSYPLDRPMRPCIQHQIGRCLGPCGGHISREEYLKLIDEIRLFLSGKRRDLMEDLDQRMRKLSEEMKYEEAAKIRDRIKAIEKAWEVQKIVAPALGDLDIIGFYKDNGRASFRIFFIRNGMMIGSKDYFLKHAENVSDRELMHTFIMQLYSNEIIPPSEIVVFVQPRESKALQTWLGQRRGGNVKILSPKSGKKRDLLDMATENARFLYHDKREEKAVELIGDVKEKLKLERLPADIGAFDVSTISGDQAVGAFIYWSEGEFRKDRYRRLKIKTVAGIDDYSMMEEIVGRIIDNLECNLPDLIIIDGGKGHLETAGKVMDRKTAQCKEIPMIIAIAKEPDRAYLRSEEEPIDLEDNKPSSLLLKGIRDEVHRFAIGYHRKLRGKELLQSPLEKITGIGKKRRLELLRVFGSIKDIKNATIDEISKLRGFNKKIAAHLLDEIRRTE